MRCGERVWKAGVVVAMAAGLAGVAGCNKLRARDLLNQGVQAYKNAQFDQAEEDFKQAAQLDPTLKVARIYLATAYASQYVPGSPSPANQQYGQEAIAQFKQILDTDPNNLSAIDGIGSMLYNMATSQTPHDAAMLEQAKKYHEKHIQLQPDAAQPYYWVAVIDWTLAFDANRDMRAQYNTHLKRGQKPILFTDPLPPNLRDQFAAKYSQTVDQGIQDAKKAIQLRPDYADAMSYLNLLYRQEADMASSKDQRDALLKQADQLVDEVNQIKQKQAATPKSSS
jgi:tetratricopeptide (TPR) repeat protein